MGNCQAADTAAIVIQHPTAAKIERLYSPITAADVMKSNPGHYVALLLTTTRYSSSGAGDGVPLRVTRIKLLRPDETLVLGHVYRLVTTQEAMKGLWAKKQAKMEQQRHGETRENQAQVLLNTNELDFQNPSSLSHHQFLNTGQAMELFILQLQFELCKAAFPSFRAQSIIVPNRVASVNSKFL